MSRLSQWAEEQLASIDNQDEVADDVQAAINNGSAWQDSDLSRMAAGYIAAGLCYDTRERAA